MSCINNSQNGQKIWFVTRLKSNAKYHVKKVFIDNSKKKKRKGVIKEQLITVGYTDNGEDYRLELRRIEYLADDGRLYVFVTNNMTLAPLEIANIYKYRWVIELLFKQIKQNFPLRYFWGESENAIKMQVYMVLIAQLLTVVIRKKAETKKSFANVITLIRLHLMSYVDLEQFIKNTYACWRKANAPPNLFAR
jgi:IS4 transposase